MPVRRNRAADRARKSAGERRPELLAPAGDAECLDVALRAGADAVYFGLQEGFNARARAGNFSLATLAETVAAIHAAGARAYLTVNTLVFEPELAAVEGLLQRVHEAGVDAVLVQDPAVALLAQRVAPGLAIHASTQMTISSPEAATFAADLGVVRVVVPRELSVREIETFIAGTELETEVFVHGALCVSWSGQCLTSEAWGGRSANRGQCAQSCRLPYDLYVDGERRELGDIRYLLSPKDLAGVRAVPELAALGVHGLKIEGRQKGPQYVATAVQMYRHWLDAVACGEAETPAAQVELGRDLRTTSLAYTRGFGDGFLAGSDHQSLVEGRFPKHRGVYLGRVVRVAANEVVVQPDSVGRPWTGGRGRAERSDDRTPQGTTPRGTVSAPLPALGGATDAASGAAIAPLELRAGMGVVFDRGQPEDANEPGGPIFGVDKTGDRWVLRFGDPGPDLRRVAQGHRVWVTSDPAIAREVDRLRRGPAPRARISVQLAISGSIGSALRIEAHTASARASVTTRSAAAKAAGRGLDRTLLEEKLGAFGDTEFELESIDTRELAPGLHVPVSELKAARREIVEALRSGSQRGPAAHLDAHSPRPARPHFALPVLAAPESKPRILPLCRSEAQLEAALAAGCDEVELDWMELVGLGRAVARARSAGARVSLATLRIQKPGEAAFDDRLARLEPDGVLVRHWGGMVSFAERRAANTTSFADLRIHGDFSLNVTNSITARHLLGWGLDTLTAAHDLDEQQLFALLANAPAERFTVVVHHRIPTFHTEHCVVSHLLSDGRDYRTCGRPCESHQVALRDPAGRVHPVIVDAGCRNTVFNGEVQSAARLVPQLLSRGVRRFRVELVRETQSEAAAVLAAYQALLAGRLQPEALLAELGVAGRHGVSGVPMRLLIESAP